MVTKSFDLGGSGTVTEVNNIVKWRQVCSRGNNTNNKMGVSFQVDKGRGKGKDRVGWRWRRQEGTGFGRSFTVQAD
jgi:hypothetical protein